MHFRFLRLENFYSKFEVTNEKKKEEEDGPRILYQDKKQVSSYFNEHSIFNKNLLLVPPFIYPSLTLSPSNAFTVSMEFLAEGFPHFFIYSFVFVFVFFFVLIATTLFLRFVRFFFLLKKKLCSIPWRCEIHVKRAALKKKRLVFNKIIIIIILTDFKFSNGKGIRKTEMETNKQLNFPNAI